MENKYAQTAMTAREQYEEHTNKLATLLFVNLYKAAITLVDVSSSIGGRGATFTVPVADFYSIVSYRLACRKLTERLALEDIETTWAAATQKADAKPVELTSDFPITHVVISVKW